MATKFHKLEEQHNAVKWGLQAHDVQDSVLADCRRRKTKTLLFGLVGVLLLCAGQAFADLIGDTVTVDYLYPDISTVFQVLGTGTVTAGGFTVHTGPSGMFNYTVFGSEVALTFDIGAHFLPASFNGWELINDTGSPAINGVTVGFFDVPGFDDSRVTFDATHVWLNMADLVASPGQDVQLDLRFATPEPTTIALLGLGVGALGFLRYRLFR